MSTKSAALSLHKQRGKPFERGRSGNPAGKARGTRARATILGEKILQDDAEAIVRAVIGAAKDGDMQAARLCLERLSPPRRSRPVVFPLPALDTVDDIGKAFSAIVAAMDRGELTPDEANAVAAVVELRRKAIETGEMDARLSALERAKERPR